MSGIRVLTATDWRTLRALRLAALRESPKAFLSSWDAEVGHGETYWRRETGRGDWLVALDGGRPVGLLGATREPGMPAGERYLGSLWVAPDRRRRGVGSRLVTASLERLTDAGVAAAWLWVLDGNDLARRFYEHHGFVSTGERQPLPADDGRYEERMRRIIASA